MPDRGTGLGDDDVALRASGVGRWSFVPGTYTIQIDDVLAELLGAPGPGLYPIEDLMGAVHPEDRTSVFTALESVSLQCQLAVSRAAAGGPDGGLEQIRIVEEFRLRHGAEQATRWVRLRGGVVPDGEGGVRVTGVAADTSALRTSRERTGRTLAQVSEGVVVLEPDWTIAYVNDSAALLLDREGRQLVGRTFWDELPESPDSPMHVNCRWAMENKRPVMFETPTVTAGWIEVRAYPSTDGLSLYLRSVEAEHEAERERVQLIDRLERSLARGRQLLALTRALSTAVTVRDVADVVTVTARRSLGTVFAGLALVDEAGRGMEYVSVSPLPPPTAALWSRFPLAGPAPVSTAARLGKPFFHEDVEQAVADFPESGPGMTDVGMRSQALLPLVAASGDVLGTLALAWGTARPMAEGERDFLVTVAGHTAQAVERARLFEHQRGVAEALQTAVLPTRLPTVPGTGLAATFVPATGGPPVGGDWYDAFVLPSGLLGVAVGDAAGHGLPAARVMSGLRNALRAYALLGHGPGWVVTTLDRFVARMGPDAFATVAYLELDPVSGEGLWAAAGHPPLVRVVADGEVSFAVEEPDPPLGSLGPDGAREHHLRLGVGDTLLLYTDGLVERRNSDLGAGLDLLRDAVVQSRTASAVALVTSIRDRLVDSGTATGTWAGVHGPTDDVCLVAVRRTPETPARRQPEPAGPDRWMQPRTEPIGAGTQRPPWTGPDGDRLTYTLAPEPGASYEARVVTRLALDHWGLDGLTDTLTLVVSELVTNAVTHAGSAVRLELERVAEGVRVSVSDGSAEVPEHRRATPREEHGRGVHLVDVLATRWGTDPLPGGKRVWAELDVP